MAPPTLGPQEWQGRPPRWRGNRRMKANENFPASGAALAWPPAMPQTAANARHGPAMVRETQDMTMFEARGASSRPGAAGLLPVPAA